MTRPFLTGNPFIPDQIAYIQNLIRKGGPEPNEWPELNHWIESLAIAREKHLINEDDLDRIRLAFGDSFSLKTIQGLGFQKPRGYAGDFEIIDRMYTNYLSSDSDLRRWDEFTPSQDFAFARLIIQNILACCGGGT